MNNKKKKKDKGKKRKGKTRETLDREAHYDRLREMDEERASEAKYRYGNLHPSDRPAWYSSVTQCWPERAGIDF